MRVQLHLKCIVGLEGGRGYTERERGNKENKYERGRVGGKTETKCISSKKNMGRGFNKTYV